MSAARTMAGDPRDRGFDDLKEGEALRPLRVSVTREHINGFQDFLGHHDPNTIEGTQWLAGNNLHVDEEFSRRNMFGGVVGDG
ncbi:MAG: hypothetical protein IT514_04355, partial [Burkholderiales bacterium]|nr:hypothetical protein [Burkholderiales bacterium]